MPPVVPQDLIHRIPAIQQTMDVLRADNENNEGPHAAHFSRACLGCGTQDPVERHASLACGHAVCRGCADAAADVCPLCRQRTRFVRLFEEETRECEVCLCPEPTKRGFFPRCGHIRCDSCIASMWYNAMIRGARFACPHCDQVSKPIKLVEEPIECVAPSRPFVAIKPIQEPSARPLEATPILKIHATRSMETEGNCRMDEETMDRNVRARTVS